MWLCLQLEGDDIKTSFQAARIQRVGSNSVGSNSKHYSPILKCSSVKQGLEEDTGELASVRTQKRKVWNGEGVRELIKER